MKKLPGVEVEPLSSERWSKIERSLFARVEREADAEPAGTFSVRRGRRIWAWVAAAAVAGAAGGIGVSRFESPKHAEVEQPSRVTTGASASHLALPGLAVDVEPDSAVVVGAETPKGLLIVVDRGSVVCDVAPRTSSAPLVVQAGAARVRVVGTRFKVTRLGESAEVVVQKGTVEVSARGQSWLVQAGETWPPPTPAVTAPEAASTASAPVKRAPPERAVPAAGTPAPSRQALFEQATGLERSDPKRAVELYSSLERGGDSWAQNALYAHGRLEASRGNAAGARRLLESYLGRFPSGKNADDARSVLRGLR